MGSLYIVATPIGNLKDITLRAIDVLKSVDYVLCEDTRITGKLLKHFSIDKKLESFNDFNEEAKIHQVIKDLISGKNIALVSDAGTPLISDPGYKLVRSAILDLIKIESIPGSSSIIAAISISGLPPDKFLFIGYPSKKPGKRVKLFRQLFTIFEVSDDKTFKPTIILYESPYRILKTLEDIKQVFGEIDIVICRELTKLHEEVRREKVSRAIEHFSQIKPKGEFVILF